jgi:hypothetical protein
VAARGFWPCSRRRPRFAAGPGFRSSREGRLLPGVLAPWYAATDFWPSASHRRRHTRGALSLVAALLRCTRATAPKILATGSWPCAGLAWAVDLFTGCPGSRRGIGRLDLHDDGAEPQIAADERHQGVSWPFRFTGPRRGWDHPLPLWMWSHPRLSYFRGARGRI